MHHHLPVVRLLDEVVQHLLGLLEVGNHAILHRLDGDDVARRSAKHLLGLLAHSLHFARHAIHRDDRRLIHDDALAMSEDKSVGRPQIDREIA